MRRSRFFRAGHIRGKAGPRGLKIAPCCRCPFCILSKFPQDARPNISPSAASPKCNRQCCAGGQEAGATVMGIGSSPPQGGQTLGVVSRSEEHTSELQSLMRISYAVFCLKKKKS